MDSLESDTAILLHLVRRGTSWTETAKWAQQNLGWDKARAKAAQNQVAHHVSTFTSKIQASGEALLAKYPDADDNDAFAQRDASRAMPLASLTERREILRIALDTFGEKYQRPFVSKSFASFSVIGTNDWQDYASTVLQLVQLDTLLSIEALLERLTDGLDRDSQDSAAEPES